MSIEHVDPGVLTELRDAVGADDDGASALGWPAVHAFEQRHGVVLPEPYRSFVAEVSDGSHAGPPEYGLLALGTLPSDYGGDGSRRDLTRPFPLTEPWLWEGDDEEPDEARLASVFDDGSIVLGTDGCGMNWHLVVTGVHRGQVWMVSGEGAMPFGHVTGEPGFAGWVRHWAAGEEWFDAG
ncbi:SMI1/KNR4 family protein [Actinoplanes xinjiangensis]|uniref:SMI1/KNR4 family protein n=1 Tax=Actinoplanes xinjiangensis TaxID=512350 RepID=UPI00344A3051